MKILKWIQFVLVFSSVHFLFAFKMENTSHIEGLTGVVVSGQSLGTTYQLNFIGFGVANEYEHPGITKFLKLDPEATSPFSPKLFEDESGKKIKDMLEHAAVIFVLNPDYLEPLKNEISNKFRVVEFSSIFGMSPMQFLTASPYGCADPDPRKSEEIAFELASYFTSNLLEYYIFGPWIQYIAGLYKKVVEGGVDEVDR